MGDTSTTVSIIKAIVAEQKTIIGPLAVDQANKVQGLRVSSDVAKIEINGDGKTVVENLVLGYKKLFGDASVIACKEAVKERVSNISSKDLPPILQ